MSSLKNAPDIMGEALGRLPIRPLGPKPKVVAMAPETPARAQALWERLKRMRLQGMATLLEEQMAASQAIPLAVVQQMERLVEREEDARSQRRLRQRLKKAGLPLEARVEEIDYAPSRHLDPTQVAHLARCAWVEQGHDLILHGPTGAGKTYLASALSNAACVHGYKTLYRRLADLLREVAEARQAGGLEKYLADLAKMDLLILDDWGLEKLDQEQGMDLLYIVDQRHGRRSILVASPLALSEWGQAMTNQAIAQAVMDRLGANAHRLELGGPSLRPDYSPLRRAGTP